MGTNVHIKRPNGRSTASGRGHKGLVDQEKTFKQRQEEALAADVGRENMLLDRYLDAKSGSPAKSLAWAALQKCRGAKSR